MNMNVLAPRVDRHRALRWGSRLLLTTMLFVGACQPNTTSAPRPTGREVATSVSCGNLPVVGVYYHAVQQDGSAPGGFASWAPEKGDPTKASATASVPIGTIAMRFDIGCGGTPNSWAINSRQDAQRIESGLFNIRCNFTPSDLPEAGSPTENLANACTITPELPRTA